MVVVHVDDFERAQRRRPRREVRSDLPAVQHDIRHRLHTLVPIVDRIVAAQVGIAPEDLYAKKRMRAHVDGRSIACLVLRHLAGASWPALGAVYGLRHDTLLRSTREFEWYINQINLPTVREVERMVQAEIAESHGERLSL